MYSEHRQTILNEITLCAIVVSPISVAMTLQYLCSPNTPLIPRPDTLPLNPLAKKVVQEHFIKNHWDEEYALLFYPPPPLMSKKVTHKQLCKPLLIT